MGKMLLGSFAISLGFGGFMGMGSSRTSAVMNPSAYSAQQKQAALQRQVLNEQTTADLERLISAQHQAAANK
jgi:hypothetical protein